MRERLPLAIAVGGIVLTALTPISGGAQPFSREQLLTSGNVNFRANCVRSAMNYYAILQQFPGWPSAEGAQRMRDRIRVCAQGSIGFSETGGKADDPNESRPSRPEPPAPLAPAAIEPPRARACRAYAETALVQAQAQSAGRCGQQGARWSSSFATHYDWCMSAATPGDVQRETGERNAALNSCVYRW